MQVRQSHCLCLCLSVCTGVLLCVIQVTGIQNAGQTISLLVRGSNKLILEEAERSIHDALCVIRCLVKKRSVSLCVSLSSSLYLSRSLSLILYMHV